MSILQGTIPDDWQGDYCCYAVEWPSSPQWLAILRGVLVLPSRGRFWDENTGNIIDAQNVIRATYDNNLHLEEVIMSCNDPGLAQIAIALTKIADSMAANGSNCCDGGGSGGAGSVEPPFNEFPENDPETDPPPDGFDTWEEFYAQKCAIAWDIVEKLALDLGNMSILAWGSAGSEALTAEILIILVTPVPPAAIIAAVLLLLTAGAIIILSTALSIINDNVEELTCELYNGIDSSSSRALFLSKFNDLVDAGVADPVSAFAIKTVISYMVGASVTNRLYVKDTARNYLARDCQGCVEICSTCISRYNKEFAFMNYVDAPSDWFQVDDQGGQGQFTVYFAVSGPDNYKILFRTLTGHAHFATPDFTLQNDNSDIIYAGDSFAAFATACEENCMSAGANMNWLINSSTQFTVEIKTEFCF